METKGSGHWVLSQTYFQDLMVQSEQFKLKPASCTWNERYSTYVHLNSIQALRKTLIIKQIKSLKTTDKKLNVDAADFRPTRNVVAVANLRINDVIQYENEPTI